MPMDDLGLTGVGLVDGTKSSNEAFRSSCYLSGL